MSDVNDVNNARYLKYRTKFFISEFFGTALLLIGRPFDRHFHVWIR